MKLRNYTLRWVFGLLLLATVPLLSCERPTAVDFNNPHDPDSPSFSSLPGVTTLEITDIGALTALSGGSFSGVSGFPITEKGVCWSTAENPDLNASCTDEGGTDEAFVSILTDLLPETVYFVRAYASNREGTVWGSQRQFTTGAGPIMQALQPDNVQALSVTLRGSVTGDGFTELDSYGFCVRTFGADDERCIPVSSSSKSMSVSELLAGLHEFSGLNELAMVFGRSESADDYELVSTGRTLSRDRTLNGKQDKSAVQRVIPEGDVEPLELTLNDVQPDIRYQFRVYGLSGDVPFTSEGRDVITRDGVMEINTAEATSVGAFVATISGAISDDGGAEVTARGVCFATTENPDLEDTCVASGTGTGSFSVMIEELSPDTRYYARAYGRSSAGVSYGNQVSFSTRDGMITVMTGTSPSVGAFTATIGVVISDDGGADVTARGVCFATTENPDLNDTCVASGTGTGSFSVMLEELTPDTRYYARAYATNAVGTQYGSQVVFTTADGLSQITTLSINSITQVSAVSGGNISDDGGSSVKSRGVVWSTSETPTIEKNDGLTTNGSDTGIFSSTMTGLSPITTYYVRAYSTNTTGTAYGEQRVFRTLADEGERDTETVIVDVTNPVTGRVWMDRNLGANQVAISSIDTNAFGDLYQWGRGADGHQRRNSPTTTTLSSTDQPGHGSFILATENPRDWRAPQNNSLWQGINGKNNPCPFGYRIPTEAEWNVERSSWTNNNAMGAFTTPLKLTLAGLRNGSSTGSLFNLGENGYYWSATVSGSFARYLGFVIPNAFIGSDFRVGGASIRCIKDGVEVLTPSVVTNSVSSITQNAALSGGNITDDGGGSVTSRGVVWSTLQNATLDSNEGMTTDGSGTGSFTSDITGLSAGITYYVRAYAINNIGTAYGEERSFTTLVAVNVSVRDTETLVVDVTNPATGRVWMDRNLGASRAAITQDDELAYGDLYQWGRGADGHEGRSSATTTSLSGTDQPNHGLFIITTGNQNDWRNPQNNNLWQGIDGINNPCPIGYRIPSEAEWNTERLSWDANNAGGAIDSKLRLTLASYRSSASDWIFPTGTHGYYWSSTVNAGNAIHLIVTSTIAATSADFRAFGFSVRCIKDGIETKAPSINTSSVSSITQSSAVSGGNITDDGGSNVTSRGVVWSTLQNATLDSNEGMTTDGSGTGSFTSDLDGLSAGTMFYVRAYATNNIGTSYGEERNFTTLAAVDYTGRDTETLVVDVTNPATGRVWMDRNLGASRVATFTSDDQAYGDLYQWGRGADGHQLRTSSITTILSSTDEPNHESFIVGASDWRSPQNDNLWQGIDGVNNPCPVGYRLPTVAEWLDELQSWSSRDNVSAFDSPLKLPGGGSRRTTGGFLDVDLVGAYWSSTVSGSVGISRFLDFDPRDAFINGSSRASGLSVRCIKDGVVINAPTVNTSSVSSISQSSAVSGGNIADDGGESVTSRGVVWSTSQNATLESNEGTTIDGSGTGSFTSNLTELSAGTMYYVRAYATNSIGTSYGEERSFSTLAAVDDNGRDTETLVVDVTNPSTGRVWMDRNLGASRAAISSTDTQAYGHLYQWGRGADGHQKRNSSTTTVLSSSDVPSHDMFIRSSSSLDWRNTRNDYLWQGTTGTNNPCPQNYRLPTHAEWFDELNTWSAMNKVGGYTSPLKLTTAGGRNNSSGSIFLTGSNAYYWSSTISQEYILILHFNSVAGADYVSARGAGNTVRCIKE